ncbi:MAG: aminopeptidase [Spirochaetaceae bacterium]|jgi:aspartyl aminopeptidase|nr:aminopeptidase [Spirochaetaceae bacterium]
MSKEKTAGQLLQEKLTMTKKTGWEGLSENDKKTAFEFAERYKLMLSACKTEREWTAATISLLSMYGFKDIDTALSSNDSPKMAPGTLVYRNCHNKALAFAIIGKKPPTEGMNILGSHIDSPRLDLKSTPLYEDGGFAYFDTHYYGGIKKYQWMSIPLALHGIVILKDGTSVKITLGEEENEPALVITDLLPHLAHEQMEKKASELVNGEELDALIGSIPYPEKDIKEAVKLNTLKLLNDKYGITEEDFAGAELELVPAGKARDIGFDQSMIGAYGHDDRCCAYPAIQALLEFAPSQEHPNIIPEKTLVVYLSDKEEIGSYGNTGADARFFEDFIHDLCGDVPNSRFHQALQKSAMLSADVGAAYDPRFSGVYDKNGSPYLGKGISLTKYTGSRGKYGASDANAEYYNKVTQILNEAKVPWQFGDLGKVDKGGGGTIALYAAKLGIEVLDCGIAVLSMHSPFEIISKIDLYNTYRAYLAFLKDA